MPLTFAETPLYYKDGQGNYHRVLSGADMTGYRTASAQDAIDAAQDADIASRAKTDEIGIVITGSRPSMAVSPGQYVIVRGSTITDITDGLYTAVNALSPSTDVTAADLTAVSGGGLNNLQTAISGLGTEISATDNVSTNVHDAIVYVLTSVGPQNWNKRVYTGPFVKKGNTAYVVFTGFYSLSVSNPGSNYATQGFVVAQGKFFTCWYKAGSWDVTEIS